VKLGVGRWLPYRKTDCPPVTLLTELYGMKILKAMRKIEDAGYVARVVKVGDAIVPHEAGFVKIRVNLRIKNMVVVDSYVG